jgi:hypothetical protein
MSDGRGDPRGGNGPTRRDLIRAGAMGLTAAAAAAMPGLASENTGYGEFPYVPRPRRPDVILTVDNTVLNPDG